MVSPAFGVRYRTGMRNLSRGTFPPIVVAHRGASRRALENSLEAFSLSLADRADMIEFDVRLSADGEPVVVHDARTGRATGGILAALRVMDEMRYGGEVLFSSGLREECLAAREARPGIPCGLVTGRPSASDIAFCRRHSLSSIHPDHRKLTVLRIRQVREAGLPLLPYTVDDEGDFFRLVEEGADGVFSNRAEELRAAWRGRFQIGRAHA